MDRKNVELMAQLQEQIDGLWRYLGHTRDAEKAHANAGMWKNHVEAIQKELSEHLRQNYSETRSYINTICVVGYAGYFAIWTLAKDAMEKSEASLVALMGLVSVGIFCAWEIFAMIMRMKGLTAQAALLRNILTPEDFEEQKALIYAREVQLNMVLTPLWIIVLTIAVSTVGIGAVVAATSFYASL